MCGRFVFYFQREIVRKEVLVRGDNYDGRLSGDYDGR